MAEPSSMKRRRLNNNEPSESNRRSGRLARPQQARPPSDHPFGAASTLRHSEQQSKIQRRQFHLNVKSPILGSRFQMFRDLDRPYQRTPPPPSHQQQYSDSVIVDLDNDDDIQIESKITPLHRPNEGELFHNSFETHLNQPLKFDLPVDVPWDKAMTLVQMEDGIVPSVEDPDNVFIVYSYSDNYRLVDMATCQCTCPAPKRSSVCSHLAAVACRNPAFRLRLTLFVVAQWQLRMVLKGNDGNFLPYKHPHPAARGKTRAAAKCIVDEYLLKPTQSTRNFKNRRKKNDENGHRGHLLSDLDDMELHVEPLSNHYGIRKVIQEIVESFVVLLNRVLQQQGGRLPTVVDGDGRRSRYVKQNSDFEWKCGTRLLMERLKRISPIWTEGKDRENGFESERQGRFMRQLEKWKELFERLGSEFIPAIRLVKLLMNYGNEMNGSISVKSSRNQSAVKQLLAKEGIHSVDSKNDDVRVSILSSCSSSSSLSSDDSDCRQQQVTRTARPKATGCPKANRGDLSRGSLVNRLVCWLLEPDDAKESGVKCLKRNAYQTESLSLVPQVLLQTSRLTSEHKSYLSLLAKVSQNLVSTGHQLGRGLIECLAEELPLSSDGEMLMSVTPLYVPKNSAMNDDRHKWWGQIGKRFLNALEIEWRDNSDSIQECQVWILTQWIGINHPVFKDANIIESIRSAIDEIDNPDEDFERDQIAIGILKAFDSPKKVNIIQTTLAYKKDAIGEIRKCPMCFDLIETLNWNVRYEAILGDFRTLTNGAFGSTADFIIIEPQLGQFIKLPTRGKMDDIKTMMNEEKYLEAFGCCLYLIGRDQSMKEALTETLRLIKQNGLHLRHQDLLNLKSVARSLYRAMYWFVYCLGYTDANIDSNRNNVDEVCPNEPMDELCKGELKNAIESPDNKYIICQDLSHCSLSETNSDAENIISRIRKEEFGIDLPIVDKEMEHAMHQQRLRLKRAVKRLAEDLYADKSHLLLELIQNADDNFYFNKFQTLGFIVGIEGLCVVNNECGFTESNVRAICDIGVSSKVYQSTEGYSTQEAIVYKLPSINRVGKFGVGFKSVFRISGSPHIFSNQFNLKFDENHPSGIGHLLPHYLPNGHWDMYCPKNISNAIKQSNIEPRTVIWLPYRQKTAPSTSVTVSISEIQSSIQSIQTDWILFLNRLQRIFCMDLLNRRSIQIHRHYHSVDTLPFSHHGLESLLNHNANTRLVSLQVIEESFNARSNQTTSSAVTHESFFVQFVSPDDSSIIVAFPIIVSQSPSCPDSNSSIKQSMILPDFSRDSHSVFSFLPVKSVGLKFPLQADFRLAASREEILSGDEHNTRIMSLIGPFIGTSILELAKAIGNSAFRFAPKPSELISSFRSVARSITVTISGHSFALTWKGTLSPVDQVILPPWAQSIKDLQSEENPRLQSIARILYSTWDDVTSFLTLDVSSSSTFRDLIHDQFIIDVGLETCKQFGIRFIEPWDIVDRIVAISQSYNSLIVLQRSANQCKHEPIQNHHLISSYCSLLLRLLVLLDIVLENCTQASLYTFLHPLQALPIFPLTTTGALAASSPSSLWYWDIPIETVPSSQSISLISNFISTLDARATKLPVNSFDGGLLDIESILLFRMLKRLNVQPITPKAILEQIVFPNLQYPKCQTLPDETLVNLTVFWAAHEQDGTVARNWDPIGLCEGKRQVLVPKSFLSKTGGNAMNKMRMYMENIINDIKDTKGNRMNQYTEWIQRRQPLSRLYEDQAKLYGIQLEKFIDRFEPAEFMSFESISYKINVSGGNPTIELVKYPNYWDEYPDLIEKIKNILIITATDRLLDQCIDKDHNRQLRPANSDVVNDDLITPLSSNALSLQIVNKFENIDEEMNYDQIEDVVNIDMIIAIEFMNDLFNYGRGKNWLENVQQKLVELQQFVLVSLYEVIRLLDDSHLNDTVRLSDGKQGITPVHWIWYMQNQPWVLTIKKYGLTKTICDEFRKRKLTSDEPECNDIIEYNNRGGICLSPPSKSFMINHELVALLDDDDDSDFIVPSILNGMNNYCDGKTVDGKTVDGKTVDGKTVDSVEMMKLMNQWLKIKIEYSADDLIKLLLSTVNQMQHSFSTEHPNDPNKMAVNFGRYLEILNQLFVHSTMIQEILVETHCPWIVIPSSKLIFTFFYLSDLYLEQLPFPLQPFTTSASLQQLTSAISTMKFPWKIDINRITKNLTKFFTQIFPIPSTPTQQHYLKELLSIIRPTNITLSHYDENLIKRTSLSLQQSSTIQQVISILFYLNSILKNSIPLIHWFYSPECQSQLLSFSSFQSSGSLLPLVPAYTLPLINDIQWISLHECLFPQNPSLPLLICQSSQDRSIRSSLPSFSSARCIYSSLDFKDSSSAWSDPHPLTWWDQSFISSLKVSYLSSIAYLAIPSNVHYKLDDSLDLSWNITRSQIQSIIVQIVIPMVLRFLAFHNIDKLLQLTGSENVHSPAQPSSNLGHRLAALRLGLSPTAPQQTWCINTPSQGTITSHPIEVEDGILFIPFSINNESDLLIMDIERYSEISQLPVSQMLMKVVAGLFPVVWDNEMFQNLIITILSLDPHAKLKSSVCFEFDSKIERVVTGLGRLGIIQHVPELHLHLCGIERWYSTIVESTSSLSDMDYQKVFQFEALDQSDDASKSDTGTNPLQQKTNNFIDEINREVHDHVEISKSEIIPVDSRDGIVKVDESEFFAYGGFMVREVHIPQRLNMSEIPVQNSLPEDVAKMIGRHGEELVYHCLLNQYSDKINAGEKKIVWMNEKEESGMPYDLVIESHSQQSCQREYIEVKATNTTNKSYFEISHREWTFAQVQGDSYQIWRVFQAGCSHSRILSIINPYRQWKLQRVKMCFAL